MATGVIANILAAVSPNPVGYSPTWLGFCDDFYETLNTSRWATVKDSGASAAITADAANGVLLLSSTATTDDDGALVQSVSEFILPTTGKRFAVEAKVKISVADQTDFFFGLSQKAATNPEAILTASNRIGFQVDDGNPSILCKSENTDVETSKDSELDFADATYRVLGISYDGAGVVSYYIDGTLVHTVTTNIPATELAIAMFHLSGNATGTRTTTWDYVSVMVER